MHAGVHIALALQPGHPQITALLQDASDESDRESTRLDLPDQELVSATGRFSLFAGKKKGRGKRSPKGKKGKGKARVGVAG